MLRHRPSRSTSLADAVCGALDADLAGPVRESVRFFLENLDASLALGDPALLAEQVQWQTRRLAVIAPGTDVERLADLTQRAVAEQLVPAEAARTAEHLAAAMRQAREVRRSEARPEDGPSLTPLARTYLDLALAGEEELACSAVMASTRDPLTLLLDVLEPVQVEVGRLWLAGEVSVEEEHAVTALTRRVLGELGHRHRPPEPTGRRVLAVTVGAEQHSVGLAMVLNALEHAGWTTHGLVDARDPAVIIDALLQCQADVLAISATMLDHVLDARAVIEAVNADPRTRHVPVVVGGRPFTQAPRLAAMVGADDWAADARGAVRALDRVLRRTQEKADDAGLLAEFSRLNNELVSSQRDAVRANAQMSSQAEQVRALVGMVAHDLTTPLQSMLGYAGLLNGDDTLTHQQRELAARIIRSGREMLALVDDLGHGLLVDVDATVVRAPVDVDALADSVLARNQGAARRRDVSVRHIRIPSGRAPATVDGDVTQLERVLERLVSNALRLTPDGGLVLVSVTVDADTVSVEVADEGPGLEVGRLETVFAPLHDPHGTAAPGITLGLAVCRRIAEQHGGSLTVSSELGDGATFTLTLPVGEPASLPLAVPPVVPPAAPTGPASPARSPRVEAPPPRRAPFLTVVHDEDDAG